MICFSKVKTVIMAYQYYSAKMINHNLMGKSHDRVNYTRVPGPGSPDGTIWISNKNITMCIIIKLKM